MSFQAQPLDMISAPNFYAPLADGWKITDPNPVTLWLQLDIDDSLGTRRYITATGAALQVTFPRRNLLQQNLLNAFQPAPNLSSTPQSVVVNATVHAQDASLWSVALTSDNIKALISGTVMFQLTEGASVTSWSQNYLITKTLTAPGC